MILIIGNNLPDYRGRFLRHVGGNSEALGIAQNDAIREITGRFFPGNNWGFIGVYYADGAFRPGDWNNSNNYLATGCNQKNYKFSTSGATVKNNTGEFRFAASRVVPTAVENRPVNMSIKYIICAKE